MRRGSTAAALILAAPLLALASSRSFSAHTAIQQIGVALELYRADLGRFPSTAEGLDALVSPPSALPSSAPYREGGYLASGKVPLDPWGNAYRYRFPGEHNPANFELWSLGADGLPGGEGFDADIENWSEAGLRQHRHAMHREHRVAGGIAGLLLGTVTGLPLYCAYALVRRLTGRPRRVAFAGHSIALLFGWLAIATLMGLIGLGAIF